MERADGSAATRRMCPRCDYDLTGAVSSWTDSCPVRGTCSECGLEFAWSDIFNERLAGPRWSFEHGRRWSVSRLLETMARGAMAPGPWSSLRLELRINVSRLLWMLAVCGLLVHISLGVGVVVEMMVARRIPLRPMGMFLQYALPALAWPYSGTPIGGGRSAALGYAAWVGMQWAFMPLSMLLLDETFRRVKVRRVHLLRGVCYSSVAAIASFLLAALVLTISVWILSARFLAVLVVFVPTVWLFLWWYSFAKSYLRLPRAGAVVGLLMGLTLLAAITCIVLAMMLLE